MSSFQKKKNTTEVGADANIQALNGTRSKLAASQKPNHEFPEVKMGGEGLKRKRNKEDIEDDEQNMKAVPKEIVKVEWLSYFSKLELNIIQAEDVDGLPKIDDLFQ